MRERTARPERCQWIRYDTRRMLPLPKAAVAITNKDVLAYCGGAAEIVVTSAGKDPVR
jgi:hypothetical protein